MDALELVPKLLGSGIDGDCKMIETTSLKIIKKIRKDYPHVADEMSQILSCMGSSSTFARFINSPPLPVDKESRYALVNVEDPSFVLPPILNEYTQQ